MIALGLNGWEDGTHDASAAILADGQVIAFIEQERLSRHKHAVGEFPRAAARQVLALAGMTPSDVEHVAYGWNLASFYRHRHRSIDVRGAAAKLTGIPAFGKREVRWVRHHDAHAASAFYGSGYREAAVLVVDAEGEQESASIYKADEDGMKCVRRFGRDVSLGLMYRAVSEYCGFGKFGAGKTMGLASYATTVPEPLPIQPGGDGLTSPFSPSSSEDEITDAWIRLLIERYGPPGAKSPNHRAAYPPLEAHRPIAAAAAQVTLGLAMKFLAEEAIRLTGCSDLCMAGGVALNCAENGKLLLDPGSRINSIHIPPYPHDAGVSLGSAQLFYTPRTWRQETRADFGSSVSSVAAYLSARRLGLPVKRVNDSAKNAAELVARGKIIGWVQGRMEVGPRALGQRSIIALPNQAATRDKLNELKGRERWRPLAPALLEEEVSHLFVSPVRSPFMLFSVPMSDVGLSTAPAAAHVDGSARLQTVNRDGSMFRSLLEHVKELTGIGLVVNTSFNSRGEPIVRTAQQALEAACRIGLDAVVINDLIVTIKSE